MITARVTVTAAMNKDKSMPFLLSNSKRKIREKEEIGSHSVRCFLRIYYITHNIEYKIILNM